MTLPYRRILLKISGEVLAGPKECGYDPKVLDRITTEICEVKQRCEVQLSIVVGGGNILRGKEAMEDLGVKQSTADHMGMLATILNALALGDLLGQKGIKTRVMTAIETKTVAEHFIRLRAIRHLEKGRVVIFGAGTGNPFFTTDTAATLRASEIEADVILKATNVDGVFDRDPKKYENAVHLPDVTFERVLKDKLSVMDMTAIALAQERKIPIVIFNLEKPGNIEKVIRGEGKEISSLVHN